MGKEKKDKTTRYTAFDYMSGGRIRKLGDRVGVDASDYNVNYGRPSGSGRTYKGDRDDYNKAVTDAARNDYDYRRTLEAAALSGKKKAQKLQKKGFNDIGDVINAQNFSEKAAKRHGQGGDFASNSDYMGLTKSMVQRDRRKQTEAIDASVDEKVTGLRNEFLEKIKAQEKNTQIADEEKTVETSSRLADARNAVSEMENGMFGGVNQHSAPDEDQQTGSIAQQMLADKKKQIADGLKPSNPAGL